MPVDVHLLVPLTELLQLVLEVEVPFALRFVLGKSLINLRLVSENVLFTQLQFFVRFVLDHPPLEHQLERLLGRLLHLLLLRAGQPLVPVLVSKQLAEQLLLTPPLQFPILLDGFGYTRLFHVPPLVQALHERPLTAFNDAQPLKVVVLHLQQGLLLLSPDLVLLLLLLQFFLRTLFGFPNRFQVGLPLPLILSRLLFLELGLVLREGSFRLLLLELLLGFGDSRFLLLDLSTTIVHLFDPTRLLSHLFVRVVAFLAQPLVVRLELEQ